MTEKLDKLEKPAQIEALSRYSDPSQPQRILAISSFEKGQAFLRQVAAMGVRIQLLTVESLGDADWPKDILEEFHTMPGGMTEAQILNTVTFLARTRRFDRVVALDEFDMRLAAILREHMRVPGMGLTTTANFRDKLAMRFEAARFGVPVPEFVPVLQHDALARYLAEVPGPWVLKPRSEASAIGIRKIGEAAQLWSALEELGDGASHFLLERFVPGEIFHVDSVISEREVVFASVSEYGKPPMQTMHEGGVFSTRVIDRSSKLARDLGALNGELMPALGMVRGVTHAEYIRDAQGKFYFLEAAARVGGAFIADVAEAATGINLWAEWARIEVCSLLREPYVLPPQRAEYAGSVLCLARMAEPDTTAFQAPEIVERLKKHHHAGLIVRSPDPERIRILLEEYSQRFVDLYLAVEPVPETAP
jgi:biotin carboxylase